MVDAALLNWTLAQFLGMVVIMTRVGPLVFQMPILGSRSVPMQVKALFTLMTALVLVPVVKVSPDALPTTAGGFAVLILREVAFGAILSVFVQLVFSAVDIAGQMVGIQMGMGMATIMNPDFNAQVSPIGQLWDILAILIFLGINGHHLYFRTLVESFNWVKPGGLQLGRASYEGLMAGTAHMFVLAVKIMAPATAALFFAQVAMGIIAKTVPQIPILIVGMPINLALGFIFVALSLGFFLPLMIQNFEMLGRLLPRLAMGLGG
ncbi:MAG: flagellar biosynthetic protein FliR [Desulfobacteraceae bacterium]|nr:flagellar biosynthetic protein FliR [Desulfobacteraceae bacterium]